MSPGMRWTRDELDRALAAAPGGLEAMAVACPFRPYSTILHIASDLHRLHQGQRPHHLSRRLQQHLAPQRGHLQCPLCGQVV